MAYETIIVETRGKVGLITLNRPKALNALNSQVLAELLAAHGRFEADTGIGAIVITGSEKAFAAGADIKEMQAKTYVEAYLEDFFAGLGRGSRAAASRSIAAVAGYALGGGCELAMMCDFIIAADTAKFGQPEINARRHARRRRHAAPDPLRRQVQGDGHVPDRPDDGRRRGRARRPGPPRRARRRSDRRGAEGRRARSPAMSLPAVMMAKEAVNRAFETTLAEGAALRAPRVPLAVRDSRTRRKAWRPSPRKGLRISATADLNHVDAPGKLAYKPHQPRRPLGTPEQFLRSAGSRPRHQR